MLAGLRAFSVVATFSLCLLFARVCRADDRNAAEAEKSYQRGLVAADQQAWDLAITNFWDAWSKSARREPRYLYSLGLAEAKAGRNLGGAAWLRAYLERSPTAPNAAAVRAEIAQLEQSADTEIRQVFATAPRIYAAEKNSLDALDNLAKLAVAQARYGLIDEAFATVREYYAFYSRLDVWSQKACRDEGYYAEKSYLESRIWDAYLEYAVTTHDAAKAQQALRKVDDGLVKPKALCDFAYLQVWLGDTKGAADTLAQAEKLALKLENPSYQQQILYMIKEAYGDNLQFLDARRIAKNLGSGSQTDRPDKYGPANLEKHLGDLPGEIDGFENMMEFYATDGVLSWARAAQPLSKQSTSGETRAFLQKSASSTKDSMDLADDLNQVVFYLSHQFASYNYLRAVDFKSNMERTRSEANRGNPCAQIGMGWANLLNGGNPPNYTEVARWYQKAADQNHPVGLVFLAGLYKDGLGVPKNLEKAAELYIRAANVGYPGALDNLWDFAEAYYKAGQFREAVATQQNAISHTTDQDELAKYQAGLRKYQRAAELRRQLSDDEIKKLGN